MLFDIEVDAPGHVAGWVAPDHPSAQPVVVASGGAGERIRILAGERRPELAARRLHATGTCGFRIDARTWPDFEDAADVSLFEEGSNILIYRRLRDPGLPIRLFQLETQAAPLYPLAPELSPHVRMIYSGCETVGEESLTGILNIAFTDSVFVAGAVGYRRYEPHLRSRAFRRVVLLCDPFREPAARILRLRDMARRSDGAPGGWRALGQASLAQAFAEVDPFDTRALTRALRGLSDADFLSLANTTTRLLGARSAWDAPDGDLAGAALDSLSDFDVVGFDDDLSGYLAALDALVGRRNLFRARPRDPPDLVRAAAALSRSPIAADLVDLDATVLSLARAALSAS